jgi:hypothetical protein
MASARNGLPGQSAKPVLRALAEASDWLILHGLLAGEPPQEEWLFITRRSHKVLESSDGLAMLLAAERLDVDLHSSIASRVHNPLHLSEYETCRPRDHAASRDQLREVIGGDAGDIGVPLTAEASNDTGELRDSRSERGEQEAMMAPFRVAIGVFRRSGQSPPGRRRRSDPCFSGGPACGSVFAHPGYGGNESVVACRWLAPLACGFDSINQRRSARRTRPVALDHRARQNH